MKENFAGMVIMVAVAFATEALDNPITAAQNHNISIKTCEDKDTFSRSNIVVLQDAVLPPKIQTKENSIVEISS